MSKRHSQQPPYTPTRRRPPIAVPPERTHRLLLQECPTCGKPINASTVLREPPRAPAPHNHPLWSVCADCTGLAVFDQTTRTLRLPTGAELAACPPAHRHVITRLRDQIRQHDAAWRAATTPLGA